MNTKILLVFLLGILATTGSTCINDGFLVAVNVPISGCLQIRDGSTLSWSTTDPAPQVFNVAELIDQSYLDHIKNSRVYDIRISVKGTYNGSVSGIGYINGLSNPIVQFTGRWSDFATPRSILTDTVYVKKQAAGIAELVRVLNLVPTNRNQTIAISSQGLMAGPSSVSGLSVCYEIMAQADAEIK
jgi:hypothetical protein